MIYKYDEAIVSDLEKSFNPEGLANPIVKVIDPEGVPELIAQIQEDNVQFPVVALNRDSDIKIDNSRVNFSRMHKGVAAVLDNDTNELYYEKVIPIELSYELSVLATNTADIDEIVRELMFKYVSMYFISFELPYESNRRVRFGIEIDKNASISRKSGAFDYLSSGTLHETIIPLKCQGAVLVSYTPCKLMRSVVDHNTVVIEP